MPYATYPENGLHGNDTAQGAGDNDSFKTSVQILDLINTMYMFV